MTSQRPSELAVGIAVFPARTPTLPPATTTNSYALGTGEVLLVEPATPYDDERRAWLGWARALRAKGGRPVALLLTHHHADHVGGAAFLSRELSLPVWAHALTARRLSGEVEIHRCLEDGEAIALDGPSPQRWRVLHTPGHAPGHLCLHEERLGWLVVGDMMAGEGTILIEPNDGDMAEYLRQLERLLALGCRAALPAHGPPILEPGERLRFYLAHRRLRESKVLAALGATGARAKTLEELLPLAYDDAAPALFPLARLSLEAHLVKLEREGLARRDGARWTSVGER